MYYKFYIFSLFSSLSLKSCFIGHFLSQDPCKRIIITSHMKKTLSKSKGCEIHYHTGFKRWNILGKILSKKQLF